METVQQFKAIDGKLFKSENDCIKYEKVLHETEDIMVNFGKKPKDDGCKFANGGGYIQHNKEYVENARQNLLKLSKKTLNIKEDISFYWLGRYLDDSGYNCLYSE